MCIESITSQLLKLERDKTLLEMKRERAEELCTRLKSGGTSSPDAVRGREIPYRDGMADRLATLLDIEEEIVTENRRIRNLELSLRVLSEEERRVVELGYIKRKSGNVKLLSAELHRDRSSILRIGKRAAEKIKEVLDGAGS